MSKQIVIDSLGFAREARSLQGELLIDNLTRTLDMLANSAGHLTYQVEGRMGARNRPQLLLQIDGVLSVVCQRCLEGIDFPLSVRSVLEFVGDEEDLTQEEIEDDSRDFLPVQNEIDVVALIEDEVILNLPPAPRHESCALPNSGQGTGRSSPFSVLKGFKSKVQ
jgi:uncharacterized protein